MWSNMNYDSVLASGKNFIKKAQELDLSLNEVVVYPQKAQDEINSLKSENASLSSDLSAMRLKLRLFKPMVCLFNSRMILTLLLS